MQPTTEDAVGDNRLHKEAGHQEDKTTAALITGTGSIFVVKSEYVVGVS